MLNGHDRYWLDVAAGMAAALFFLMVTALALFGLAACLAWAAHQQTA